MPTDLITASFVENVNTVANATVLATGNIIEDAQIARDEAVAAADGAKDSAADALTSKELSKEWATKAFNSPITGEIAKYSSYHWSEIAKENAGDYLIDDTAISLHATWSSDKISTVSNDKSDKNHLHAGVYEPTFVKKAAFNQNYGTTGISSDLSRDDHTHIGTYEPAFGAKNTAFNKNFGANSGEVAEGDHTHTDYMPKVVENTAYNKNFGTANGDVSQGNHIHAAENISYNPDSNKIITSTTVQGAVGQLDAYVGVFSVSENSYLSAGSSTQYERSVSATNTPEPILMALASTSTNNATLNNGASIDVLINPTPAKKMEGFYTVTITLSSVDEVELYIYISGVGYGAPVRGTNTLTITRYLTNMLETGFTITPYVANVTNTNNIFIESCAIAWEGAPQGAIVASGTLVDHSNITGTGAANGVHTTSDVQDLDTELLAKADKVTGAVAGNLASLDADGNLVDSGEAAAAVHDHMSLIATPVLDNFVSMTSGGDSKDSGVSASTFAAKQGSSTESFEVLNGSTTNEAVNKGQLDGVQTDVNSKIPKVSTPTLGNFPQVAADGTLVNSVYDETSFASTTHVHSQNDVSGLVDDLNAKYEVVSPATQNNIVIFDTTGLVKDSGTSINALNDKVSTSGDTMTGNLEVPSITVGGANISPYSNRNKLINGDFSIWQRGISDTLNSGEYGYLADRWLVSAADASRGSVLVYKANNASDEGSGLVINCQALGDASAGLFSLVCHQRIEDVHTLSNKTVTLSFDISNSTIAFITQLGFTQYFGAGGSAPVSTYKTTVIPTGSSRVTESFTLPSIAGKIITDRDYLETRIMGTNASPNVLITNVQVEEGAFPTPYEIRHKSIELFLCQRYYSRTKSAVKVNPQAIDSPGYGGLWSQFVSFATTMYEVPTMTSSFTDALNNTSNGAAHGNINSVTAAEPTKGGFNLSVTTGFGTTGSISDGTMALGYLNMGDNDFIEANAEI